MRSLGSSRRHPSRRLGSITAKNISGAIELVEIVFEPRDLTTVLETRKLAEAACSNCLYLTWRDLHIVVDGERPVVSVGREDYNDLVIKYAWISRTHASFENRKGVFVVTDKSTNGTFIYPSAAPPFYVNKGEQPLTGEGSIVFGREREPGSADECTDTLRYAVR
jgi:adenylate cyclase